MKPEMITLKAGQATIKMPASALAQLALASVISQVVPQQPAPLPAGDVPTLGAYWPGQGGVNAGLMRGHDGTPDYYLIVAIGADAEFQDVKWGPYNHTVKGADSAWDGLANTKAMLNDREAHPAADRATSYSCDGHSDYYLPARRELQLAEANCPEVFSDGWHWSSSQRAADYAFSMHFADGRQYRNVKILELRVRPVRRLFI